MFFELPYVDRIHGVCRDLYLVRQAGELGLEEMLFSKLLFLYRSPETLIRWTRLPKEKVDWFDSDITAVQHFMPVLSSVAILSVRLWLYLRFCSVCISKVFMMLNYLWICSFREAYCVYLTGDWCRHTSICYAWVLIFKVILRQLSLYVCIITSQSNYTFGLALVRHLDERWVAAASARLVCPCYAFVVSNFICHSLQTVQSLLE